MCNENELSQRLSMFQEMTGLAMFVVDSQYQLLQSLPNQSRMPPHTILKAVRDACDPNISTQIFVIQEANLIALVRYSSNWIILWSQPSPVYMNTSLDINASQQLLTPMIAAVRQLSLDLTGSLPETDAIDVRTLQIKDHTHEDQLQIDRHNSHNAESEMLQALRSGNQERFTNCFDDFLASGQPGVLSGMSSVRNKKNLVIVATTLFTRAAVDAGVLPEVSYRLSDHYIQSVEKLKQIDDLRNFILSIGTTFIHQIQRADRIGTLPIVSKTRDYISKHLHQQITNSTIAAAVGVSTPYLSRLFRAHTGISIGQYITNQRIEEAKSLLIYSSEPVSTIGLHVGYQSEAYFSRRFTQVVGQSASQFRLSRQSRSL
ncbi:AraC family transcriptional regulator [Lacticaseibacillus paracasei]|uniref:AraC family transcriptional regulator n=1 Tax=Lacticaseibacillus paracasei TaxID=1597 RepID=UPI0018993614|nr:AraC family transcriptional regulator [Lacticaseibacillus paracasei]